MHMTQTEQVISAMRENGGFATFGKLNKLLDFSSWKTKTPEATIRRIVQDSPRFFKIKPGLWALTEFKDTVLNKFQLENADEAQNNEFSHSYFQGLLVEIGNMKHLQTYIPNQDKNKLFLARPLKDVASLKEIHDFTYPEIIGRAKTVDVVWFNERRLPDAFFEVEHSTNIEHSLAKFCELQDFFTKFYIVADEFRHKQFNKEMEKVIFKPIKERVDFVNYSNIEKQHTHMCKLSDIDVI
ncbi:MAG: winged helix-turn-helix domain-containing protein [Spirochaetaceae bacterium]|nr:winged helix-turn-helix domain-containing protein [Spirochaetaceae bacterium]